MELSVDRARCEGHGLCTEAAPELLQLDASGELVLLFAGVGVPEGQQEAAVRAARVCPVGALDVQGLDVASLMAEGSAGAAQG